MFYFGIALASTGCGIRFCVGEMASCGGGHCVGLCMHHLVVVWSSSSFNGVHSKLIQVRHKFLGMGILLYLMRAVLPLNLNHKSSKQLVSNLNYQRFVGERFLLR